MSVATKDPDALLDYEFVWCAADGTNEPCNGWLGGDTIIGSGWTVYGPDDSMVVDSSAIQDFYDCDDSLVSSSTVTRAWLSGGVANREYTVTNHITTIQGRTEERSMTIKVQNR